MATPRKPTQPTAEAIDLFCAHFDDLLCRRIERQCLREYLIALLLPREHNKTLTALASLISPAPSVSATRHLPPANTYTISYTMLPGMSKL